MAELSSTTVQGTQQDGGMCMCVCVGLGGGSQKAQFKGDLNKGVCVVRERSCLVLQMDRRIKPNDGGLARGSCVFDIWLMLDYLYLFVCLHTLPPTPAGFYAVQPGV